MDLLKKNLECIKQLRPFLYGCLVPFLEKPSAPAFSDQNADQEFARSMGLSKLSKPSILIFDGIGLGDHIFKFLKNPHPETQYSVLIEKTPEIFLASLKIHDWTALISSGQVEVFVGLPENLMVAAMRDYLNLYDRVTLSNHIEHFYFYPAMQRDGPYYLAFAQAVQQAIASLQSLFLAPPEDAYRGLFNVLENFSDLHRHTLIDACKDIFKGERAIIVSSGPSLNSQLTGLKKIQKNFFVACCDSSYRILLQNGIQPNMVFCLERTKRQADLFSDLPDSEKIPLVVVPTVFPDVMHRHSGPVMMVSRGVTFGRWLWPKASPLEAGESVATLAFRVLSFMGFQEISLFGQDLAYERGTLKSHVEGIPEETLQFESDLRASPLACELEGNDGTPIASSIYWRLFRDTFNLLIPKYGVRCHNVIPVNAGAKIPQAIQVEPEVFFTTMIPGGEGKDFQAVLNAALATAQGFQKSQGYYDHLLDDSMQRLGVFREKVLALADHVSQTVHHDFPITETEETLARYRGYFKIWEERQREIIASDPEMFKTLIRPVVLSLHLKNLTTRASLTIRGKEICDYILSYQDLVLRWCEGVYFWTTRIQNLLKKTRGDSQER